MIRRALWQGLVAGTVGSIVMTASEMLEQRLTGRPDSYVPGDTMRRLVRCKRRREEANWAMHLGQGALLGPVRAVMANVGLRGPWSSAMFSVVRLTNDQILENATGIGAPPPTWPRQELVLDLVHKAVYGFATGVVADSMAARHGPGAGQEHARKRPGRRPNVGPARRRRAGRCHWAA